ncbi:MAG: HEAT repeat domain-containing protein [Bacteroidia bacterium]|nr:HEAT repeat domain-containing protein [Bacteroidia bacterium]MCC7533101.1 HEAT repeat domain-containing protein [Bacteroidia bacterium]MCZ2140919.1 HEAT repeat domain-containing protein [Bacteroidia bacterium]
MLSFIVADSLFGPFFRKYFYYYDSYPVVIQIAVFLTAVAISATIIAYLSIIFRRGKGYLTDVRTRKINTFIDNLITDNIIFNEEILAGVPPQDVKLDLEPFQKQVFSQGWVKQALVDRLIYFANSFSGDRNLLFKRLFVELELEKLSFNKLKSFNNSTKILGLVELTSMSVAVADVLILPLTNSRNRKLRSEARIAYIKLSKNDPFKFFDDATEPLLLWDQLELFKIITTTEGLTIPNFARWITYSTNKSIVSFCLKLVVHYNQHAAIPSIVKLLDNKDHYLRVEAIKCLGKLKADDIEEKLIAIYNNQPLNCQIEILKAIGRFSTGKQIQFLRGEFIRTSDFDIKKNAARSLINHGRAAKDIVQNLIDTATADGAIILKHCMNPLIKY